MVHCRAAPNSAVSNDSQQEKYKHHLDKLQWDKSLWNNKKQQFMSALRDLQNKGVLQLDGSMKQTLHHLFLEEVVYGDINDMYHIWQTIAASIKAICLFHGEYDLTKQQDTVPFDKVKEMVISYCSHILGQIINTCCMDIKMQLVFDIIHTLLTTWGPHHKTFFLQDIESLTCKLGHIASTIRWL